MSALMHRNSWRHLISEVILLLPLAGCAGEAPPADLQPTMESIPKFVTSEPDLTIGVVKGRQPYLLSGVSDATRLSDGTVVVANCQSAELRYFDVNGRFMRSVGGRGDGPGEFNLLRRIVPMSADTIAAYDSRRLRITVFAPNGDFVRTVTIGEYTQDWPDVKGWLASNMFAATRYDFRPSVAEGEHYRAQAKILLFDAVTGLAVDSISGLPASDLRAMPGSRVPFVGVNLNRRAVFAVAADRIYYGGQDDTGIRAYDTSLNPVTTTATLTRPQRVTAAVRRTYQGMLDEGSDIPRGGIGEMHYEAYAPMLPAFRDIVAGEGGRVWVQDPDRPNHYPLIWTAYESGAPVIRAELPARFFPFEFGRDWVLGVSYDEIDVERVELRPLIPGAHEGHVLSPREARPVNIPRCGSWASR